VIKHTLEYSFNVLWKQRDVTFIV